MGGASTFDNSSNGPVTPNANDDMNDPMAGGDPNANMGGAPADQNMGGDMGADTMGGDPGMGDPMGGDPGMGDDMGAEGDDSTMSIINQLSDTDREAVRAYAESMLSRDENQIGNDDMSAGDDMPQDDTMPNAGQPMMEVTFTKGQLKKINEVFGDSQTDSKDRKPLNKKKENVVSKKSPFAPKKFKK